MANYKYSGLKRAIFVLLTTGLMLGSFSWQPANGWAGIAAFRSFAGSQASLPAQAAVQQPSPKLLQMSMDNRVDERLPWPRRPDAPGDFQSLIEIDDRSKGGAQEFYGINRTDDYVTGIMGYYRLKDGSTYNWFIFLPGFFLTPHRRSYFLPNEDFPLPALPSSTAPIVTPIVTGILFVDMRTAGPHGPDIKDRAKGMALDAYQYLDLFRKKVVEWGGDKAVAEILRDSSRDIFWEGGARRIPFQGVLRRALLRDGRLRPDYVQFTESCMDNARIFVDALEGAH